MFKSKILISLILLLICTNFFILYRLNLCYSLMGDKSKDVNSINATTSELVKYLPSIESKEKLNLVIYLNEQSCNFCNSHVLTNIKFFSGKYAKNIFLFISSSDSFIKNVTKKFELSNRIKIKKFEGNNFIHPICLLLDSNNKTILELEADIVRMNEINLFFERIALLFNAFYDKTKGEKI